MNSSKPAFQEFIEANQALLKCYNNTAPEDYEKLSQNLKDSLCSSQREKVRDILSSNQLVMSNLVRQRVQILRRLGAEQDVPVRQ